MIHSQLNAVLKAFFRLVKRTAMPNGKNMTKIDMDKELSRWADIRRLLKGLGNAKTPRQINLQVVRQLTILFPKKALMLWYSRFSSNSSSTPRQGLNHDLTPTMEGLASGSLLPEPSLKRSWRKS